MLSRRHWDITDDLGRIRVEITQGYKSGRDARIQFEPLYPVAQFIFQAAPLKLLEKCNIAWPNPTMWANPLIAKSPRDLGEKATSSSQVKGVELALKAAKRRDSAVQGIPHENDNTMIGTLHPAIGMSLPQLDMISLPSRSSSGETNISDDLSWAYKDGVPLTTVTASPNTSPAVFRLPADQLQQIIDAITLSTAQSVPAKTDVTTTTRNADEIVTTAMDRRTSEALIEELCKVRPGEKRRTPTDITMHMACTAYPACTSDDPIDGTIIHTYIDKVAAEHSCDTAACESSPEGKSPETQARRKRAREGTEDKENGSMDGPMRKVSKTLCD